jgi:hypothetical protein
LKTLTPGKPGPPARPTGARPALNRQPTAEERRRAQRVLLRVAVNIHFPNKPEPVTGYTHTVSATGGMIILKEGVPNGTKFILENPKTQKRIEAHVVRPAQINPEGSLVPIEFLAPAPQFWNVFFPPSSI